MTDEADCRGKVFALAEQVSDLHVRAHVEYLPVVEDMLRSGSRDTRCIEYTLNGLLDFCGNDAVLQLYRRLCRHYFTFDPAASVSHVNAYREMYGSNDGAESGL